MKINSVLFFTDAVQCASLMIIPQFLREKIDKFFTDTDIDTEAAYPCILIKSGDIFDGEFNVVAEGHVLCETKCFVQAFVCLLSAYYVFNFAFPNWGKSTLTFIQKVIVGHKDQAKKDMKVVDFLAKLNSI